MWEWLQTNLGANIVGGLVVVLVVALIPKLRRWVRRAAVYLWRFVFSIRVVTTGKIEATRQEGREGRQAELDAERAIPLPQPRWSIRKMPGNSLRPMAHVINNGASDSVARNVEINVDPQFFAIYNEARFTDLSAKIFDWFDGKATAKGQAEGVSFTVSWSDARGDRQSASVFMDREPPHARISKARGF